MQREFIMWTIFDHPRDFPNSYVARAFRGDLGPEPVPTSTVVVGAKLDELRKLFLGMGLICFTRNEGDDANIVETWL